MPSGREYVGANHQSVRRSNRAMLFRAVHALGPITRVDLAKRTGLNAGTVSNIVDELLAAGLARETGFRSSGRAGRRAVYLQVDPSARYAVGVDLARNAVTGALVDLSGALKDRIVEPSAGPYRGELALPTARLVVDRLLDNLTPDERETVVGIGIGVPSPVSTSSGRYLSPQTFDSWQSFDITEDLERAHRLPVYVDNNANTSALAELWFGAGQGIDNFVLLTLGTGIGTGLVFDGDLYRGNHGLAGEAGHMSINLDGPRCACGNFGCLEMYASVPRVLASIQAALSTGEPSVLGDAAVDNGGELTIAMAISALQQADPLAVRVFADVARHLAAGIVNIIYTLDPQLVLIGRELSTADEALLEPVRAEVRRRVFSALRGSIQVETVALPAAPVIGAGTLALREYFLAPLGRQHALAR